MSIKLLRSSFESIRSRFQKLAEDGSVGKAWMVHQYRDVDEPGRPDVFSHADDFNAKKGEVKTCLDIGPEDVFAKLPEGSYRARRTSQIIGWQAVKGASIDASIVSKTLPDLLKQRFWGAMSECRHADTDTGFHWVAITFELAFAEIKGSALRSVRHIPLGDGTTASIADKQGLFQKQIGIPLVRYPGFSADQKLKVNIPEGGGVIVLHGGSGVDQIIQDLEKEWNGRKYGVSLEKLEENRDSITAADERFSRPKNPIDWYATFDNFAAASVLAVDVLLNWLDELEADPQPAAVVTVKTKQNEVAAEQSEPKSNRKRGRPPGSTKNDVDEDRRIWEAWGTGQYRTYAALASEKNLDADEIECALDRHRKKIAKSRRKKSG